MRNEIKIPVNQDFNLYFDEWKDFQNKVSRPYKDRYINSIYYDDDNFTTAQNNLSGISNRRKYRIRWYDNRFKDFFYEIKIKKNNLGKKISLKSNSNLKNFKNFFSFTNKDYKNDEAVFFLENINHLDLKPKIKISYQRSYYIFENKVRITYDTNLNYSPLNELDLKNQKFLDNMNVIEIKFDEKNNELAQELLHSSNFIPKRFSKYLRSLYLTGKSIYI